MPTVFLSHSSMDKDLARRIAHDLQRAGVSVWLDEWEIVVGDSISQRIQQGLEDAEFVAVLLSRASIKSGWVGKEWQSRIGEEAADPRVVVLPIRSDDCEIPQLLRDKRHADLANGYENAIQDLLGAIQTHISKRHPDILAKKFSVPCLSTTDEDEESHALQEFLIRGHLDHTTSNDSEWFIRQRELHDLVHLCDFGGSAFLLGPFGSGKTSVARSLISALGSKPVVPLYIDLSVSDMQYPGLFWKALVWEVTGLDERELTAYEALRIIEEPLAARQHVLVLDNIDEMLKSPTFDQNINMSALRHLMAGGHTRTPSIVLTGKSYPTDTSSIAISPWWNMFHFLHLTNVSEGRARHLLAAAGVHDPGNVMLCLQLAHRRLPLDLLILAFFVSLMRGTTEDKASILKQRYEGAMRWLLRDQHING